MQRQALRKRDAGASGDAATASAHGKLSNATAPANGNATASANGSVTAFANGSATAFANGRAALPPCMVSDPVPTSTYETVSTKAHAADATRAATMASPHHLHVTTKGTPSASTRRMTMLDRSAAFVKSHYRVRHFGGVFISPYESAHAARSIDLWYTRSPPMRTACASTL
eukprot:5066245-Prymnesium_polylepis.1